MDIRESGMPIIIVSAAPLDDWQKYRKAGINAFLQKPFTEEMLLTAILGVIGENAPDAASANPEVKREESSGPEKINLKNLNHIAAGDEQFVNQMLISFLTSTEKLIDEMQDAAGMKQWRAVSDLSHKMIPPCRHIGAADLCNILSAIEKAAGDNDPSGTAETMIAKALGEFEIVRNLLNGQIEKLN